MYIPSVQVALDESGNMQRYYYRYALNKTEKTIYIPPFQATMVLDKFVGNGSNWFVRMRSLDTYKTYPMFLKDYVDLINSAPLSTQWTDVWYVRKNNNYCGIVPLRAKKEIDFT